MYYIKHTFAELLGATKKFKGKRRKKKRDHECDFIQSRGIFISFCRRLPVFFLFVFFYFPPVFFSAQRKAV